MPKRKSLPVLNKANCYDAHSFYEVACNKIACKNYFKDSASQNCIIIAAQKGPHTLQNIGKIYGLTRMRICQIEKSIIQKLKNLIKF
jgi:hypothetical protein